MADTFHLSEINIHHDDESSFLTAEELILKDNTLYMFTSHQTPLFNFPTALDNPVFTPRFNALDTALNTVEFDSSEDQTASETDNDMPKAKYTSFTKQSRVVVRAEAVPSEIILQDEPENLVEAPDIVDSNELSSLSPCWLNCVSNLRPKLRCYQTAQWMERYLELYDFYMQNGHSQVPDKGKKNQRLLRWMKRQRYNFSLRKKGKPSPLIEERVNLLESLAFVWNPKAAAWEDRMQDLLAFLKKFKHCNVPSHYPPNPSLANWVKFMRRQKKHVFKGNLDSSIALDRIVQLDDLGFRWSGRPKSYSKKNI